jgi:hypothetical protein
MYRMRLPGLMFLSVVLLAADASWSTKQISEWNENDAQQLLAVSPWVKHVTPAIMPQPSEFQKREGGQMGGGKGAGVEAFKLPTIFGGGGSSAVRKEQVRPLTLRWESALPVREAERKAGQAGAPAIEEGSYAVAVYGIPASSIDGDLQTLSEALQKTATLKRNGKKEIKATRVDIFREADGAVLLYLFPRSTEIKKEDARVEFNAQIGRYYLAESFDTGAMQFHGKLEL